MSEMVERVARAICGNVSKDVWDRLHPVDRDEAMRDARRAIEAMREPTEQMIDAGESEIDWWRGTHDLEWAPMPEGASSTAEDVGDAWQAMITAALGTG